MKRVRVKSSNIRSVGWDSNQLEVEFKNGAVYCYEGVEEKVYKALLQSPSVGRVFHASVKHGGYEFSRVEDDQDSTTEVKVVVCRTVADIPTTAPSGLIYKQVGAVDGVMELVDSGDKEHRVLAVSEWVAQQIRGEPEKQKKDSEGPTRITVPRSPL